jgi:hypothetical protein
MRVDVERLGPSDRDHDAWFIEQIKAAVDDPRPSIPHDTVMARTRAIIDRVTAEKSAGEN